MTYGSRAKASVTFFRRFTTERRFWRAWGRSATTCTSRSAIGLNLRNFLHEGNGDLWIEALRSPRLSVRWILIEERAEGGDILAARARASEDFLSGFDRVIEAGGLALYRRR
jgi:hypothetical protein